MLIPAFSSICEWKLTVCGLIPDSFIGRINYINSLRWDVMASVPQGSRAGPLLINLFSDVRVTGIDELLCKLNLNNVYDWYFK